jgi:hypothetical protein
MTVITKASTASFDSRSTAMAGYVSGLTAGSALAAVAPCRIDDADGYVYMSVTTEAQRTFASGSQVDFIGFTAKAYNSGDPVTLFRGNAIASYSAAALTPGKYCYSGSVAGTLSDTAVLSGDKPVAVAISTSDIMVLDN